MKFLEERKNWEFWTVKKNQNNSIFFPNETFFSIDLAILSKFYYVQNDFAQI